MSKNNFHWHAAKIVVHRVALVTCVKYPLVLQQP